MLGLVCLGLLLFATGRLLIGAIAVGAACFLGYRQPKRLMWVKHTIDL